MHTPALLAMTALAALAGSTGAASCSMPRKLLRTMLAPIILATSPWALAITCPRSGGKSGSMSVNAGARAAQSSMKTKGTHRHGHLQGQRRRLQAVHREEAHAPEFAGACAAARCGRHDQALQSI